MQVSTTQSVATTTRAFQAAPPAPVNEPRAGGGIQGIIGDLIRSSTAGYQQATKLAGVQVDKAAIHPFETVATATGLLKSKTANVKGVNKVTSLLHTIGGFALLIMASNTSSTMRSPGETAVDLGNRVADLIDGKNTAQGWSLGWGVRSPGEGEDAPEESGIGSALGSMGMK